MVASKNACSTGRESVESGTFIESGLCESVVMRGISIVAGPAVENVDLVDTGVSGNDVLGIGDLLLSALCRSSRSRFWTS